MTERDRMKNPSINFPESREEARRALILDLQRRLFQHEPGLTYHYGILNRTFTTDAGLGHTRSHDAVQWLIEEQARLRTEIASIFASVLEADDKDAEDLNPLADGRGM